MKCSVVGLGKLGSPFVAVLAAGGHDVIGVDTSPRVVDCLNEGRAPVVEPMLAELLAAHRTRIRATLDVAEAVHASSLTFIIVPTPSLPDGSFSSKAAIDVCEKIGAALAAKPDWHLVVMCATVMPGTSTGELIPALERTSQKRCGVDFGFCYNPEFIALGSVIRNMRQPDMVLIGESDPKSGALLESLYRKLCESKPTISRMNHVSAELTKITVNTFVTAKISFANMVAEICEALPGADVDAVTNAAGADTRIGRKYFRGAVGFGGPCFPRDNRAYARLASNLGVQAEFPATTDRTNHRQLDRLQQAIDYYLPAGGRAAILGLAYKPDTPVVEESQGLALARNLVHAGTPVLAYDPLATDADLAFLVPGLARAATLQECVRDADVVVLTLPGAPYAALPLDALKPGAVILDCWRQLDPQALAGRAQLVRWGTGQAAHVGLTAPLAAAGGN